MFRLLYDNRRRNIETVVFDYSDEVALSYILLDSEALKKIDHWRSFRFLSKFPFVIPFNKNNTNRAVTGYKDSIELGVRNLIKAIYSKNEKLGLKGD